MTIKNTLLTISAAACLFSCNQASENTETLKASSESLTESSNYQSLWVKKGFVHPESVILSQDSTFLFISNIGNNESKESPDGFISKVNLDGEIIDLKWVDNIRSPKGLCIANGKLYVSAVTELLEIDLTEGKILNRYTSDEVQYLNDVAADAAGNIYVSGMQESAIYKLDKTGNFSTFYQNDEIHHPNGLLVVGENMFIGGWGRLDEAKVNEDSVGYFFKLSMSDKNLEKVTANKPGKLDGIQVKGNDFLVSSWEAGEIFVIDQEGKYTSIIDTETSLGDILYLQDKKMLFLPMNFQNEVVAVKLNN